MSDFDPRAERAMLDTLVRDYTDVAPYSRAKKDLVLDLLRRQLVAGPGESVLQLGCAHGQETRALAGFVEQLTVVDGSAAFLAEVAASVEAPNVRFVDSLFEDLDPATHPWRYTAAVGTYVLEHVADPRRVLRTVRSLLLPGGRLFVVVPNRGALSRRLAQRLGLIGALTDLTENDLRHGHRRVYGTDTLVADVEAAGFVVERVHGVVVKILSDGQLNTLLGQGFLTTDHIRALQALAEESTELSALADSIFLIARVPDAC